MLQGHHKHPQGSTPDPAGRRFRSHCPLFPVCHPIHLRFWEQEIPKILSVLHIKAAHRTKISLAHPARVFFFISVLRNAFVVIILTLAAWLYCRHRGVKGKYPIKILGTVPRGFQHVGTPDIDPRLLSALGSKIPVATIILVLEHIAISKCTFLLPSQSCLPLMCVIPNSPSVWTSQRL